MNILVTGGAGYIGSHTCVELLKKDYAVTVLDNLANSNIEAVRRVESLTGKKISFHKVDLLDKTGVEDIFKPRKFDAVIHFAGLKAVGESVEKPLHYYENNLIGTLNLCRVMDQFDVRNLVFSSSSTVYGDPASLPIKEDFPLHAANPYGQTKLMIEEILADLHKSNNAWNISLLRYFNPVGAHESGELGEDPAGIPNNLFPYIAQVAVGRHSHLRVFGNDYNTKDGTGVRDYIHVVDLALGHVKAVEKLSSKPGLAAYNLGTGEGYSVLEIVDAFRKASGKEIPVKMMPRRAGDIPACYANSEKILKELGWKAEKNLTAMCTDTWRWQSKNPNGYKK